MKELHFHKLKKLEGFLGNETISLRLLPSGPDLVRMAHIQGAPSKESL